MVIVIGGIIFFGIGLCWLWIKLIYWILPSKAKAVNPYIEAHITRTHNDKLYDEYLEWMDKNNEYLPFDKFKSDEEKRYDKKVEDANFKKWRPRE